MNELVTAMIFVKDQKEQYATLSKDQIWELSQSIAKKGSEVLRFASGKSVEAVGLMVYGKQIGERIIMTGQGGLGDE